MAEAMGTSPSPTFGHLRRRPARQEHGDSFTPAWCALIPFEAAGEVVILEETLGFVRNVT
jgi:hypothetical protein